MKLTKRQKHLPISVGIGILATYLAFGISLGALFFQSGHFDQSALSDRTIATNPMFLAHALLIIGGMGAIIGIMLGLPSMPHTPVKQIRTDTLRKRVLAELCELSDSDREMVQVYEWAGRAGWASVEASVRANPEKYPFAAALLAREAEIIRPNFGKAPQ